MPYVTQRNPPPLTPYELLTQFDLAHKSKLAMLAAANHIRALHPDLTDAQVSQVLNGTLKVADDNTFEQPTPDELQEEGADTSQPVQSASAPAPQSTTQQPQELPPPPQGNGYIGTGQPGDPNNFTPGAQVGWIFTPPPQSATADDYTPKEYAALQKQWSATDKRLAADESLPASALKNIQLLDAFQKQMSNTNLPPAALQTATNAYNSVIGNKAWQYQPTTQTQDDSQIPSDTLVSVINPKGIRVKIQSSQLDDALKQGYKVP